MVGQKCCIKNCKKKPYVRWGYRWYCRKCGVNYVKSWSREYALFEFDNTFVVEERINDNNLNNEGQFKDLIFHQFSTTKERDEFLMGVEKSHIIKLSKAERQEG